MHGQNGLLVRLDGPDASRTTWSIGDPVDRDGWTSERVGTIGRLLPHLRHFLAVRHALLKTRALGASLVELLDNVRAGVIQLDRRARLVAANDRARALLRRGDGLRDEDGRLRAALPREDAALQGLIARALPLLDGPGEGGSMPLTRPEALSRLVLHVSPVHDAGVESGRGRVGALVLAVDPADRTGIDPARVGKALGLTRAESRVAVSLAQGKTIDDIAAETGRSRTTVKWHIDSCARYASHSLKRSRLAASSSVHRSFSVSSAARAASGSDPSTRSAVARAAVSFPSAASKASSFPASMSIRPRSASTAPCTSGDLSSGRDTLPTGRSPSYESPHRRSPIESRRRCAPNALRSMLPPTPFGPIGQIGRPTGDHRWPGRLRPSQTDRGMDGRWPSRNARTSLFTALSPRVPISADC